MKNDTRKDWTLDVTYKDELAKCTRMGGTQVKTIKNPQGGKDTKTGSKAKQDT